MNTILDQLRHIPEYRDGAAKELLNVVQAIADDSCWGMFATNETYIREFFEGLLESLISINDKLEFLANRNATNESMVTELKMTNSHLYDDKEKLLEDKTNTLRNLE